MCAVSGMCALCDIEFMSGIKFSFTWSVSEVLLCRRLQWYSGFQSYQSERSHCRAVVTMVFLESCLRFQKGTEQRRQKVRKYWERSVRKQYGESAMNTDSCGDTSVDIKACLTLCVRIISTAKAKGIIPQGVCFILCKTVNIRLILQTTYFHSSRHTTCRVWWSVDGKQLSGEIRAVISDVYWF